MLPNIILIGFMGCGKSSVGRRLASLTGHRYVDTDDLITASEGRSIPEIFADKGEAYFRDAEQRVLEDCQGLAGIVLSTGGGLILRPVNQETVHKIGIVGWLDADPELLFERASRSGKRPLLHTDNPRETFFNLYASRQDLYKKVSSFRVDSTHLGHDETAQYFLEETLRQHRCFEG